MSTIRNGSVRITSSDVHKWEKKVERQQAEYEYVPNYSGRVLFVGLLIVAAVVYFVAHLAGRI